MRAAMGRWINDLIDFSARNRLLYFKAYEWANLDLTNADPQELRKFLSGDKVRLRRLRPDLNPTDLTKHANAIEKTRRTNLEEKALSTLFVTTGFATYQDPKHPDRPIKAPVLLTPVRIDLGPRDGAGAAIEIVGEAQVNASLLQYMRFEKSTSGDLFDGQSLAPEDYGLDVSTVPNLLKKHAESLGIDDFQIASGIWLGNFDLPPENRSNSRVRVSESQKGEIWHAGSTRLSRSSASYARLTVGQRLHFFGEPSRRGSCRFARDSFVPFIIHVWVPSFLDLDQLIRQAQSLLPRPPRSTPNAGRVERVGVEYLPVHCRFQLAGISRLEVVDRIR